MVKFQNLKDLELMAEVALECGKFGYEFGMRR